MKALILFLLIPLLAVSGCAAEKRDKKTEEVKWTENAFLLVGDGQIDGSEGLAYLDATLKDLRQFYGPDIWNYKVSADGTKVGDSVKERVLEDIIRIKVVCLKADEQNVWLSREELKEADDRAAEYVKTLDGSLAEKGVNENVLRRIYSDNALAKKVYDKVTAGIAGENEKLIAFENIYAGWRNEANVKINRSVWDGLAVPGMN